MEVSGVYNPISNLMELMGQESEEVETKKGSTTKTSSQSGSQTQSGDTVSLSDSSAGLGTVSANLSSGMGVIDSLDANVATLQEHFLGALNAKFEDLDIDTSERITLSRDEDGKITVANDHPDKEKIEALFEDVPVLADAFNSLADQSELSRKIKFDRNVSFARLGGLSAYMNNSNAGSSDNESFFLSLAQGTASSYFDLDA